MGGGDNGCYISHNTHHMCMYQEDLLFNLLVWGSLRLTSNYVERESGLPPEVEVLADGLPLTPQHHKHSLQSPQIGLLDPRPLPHQSFRQLVPQW